MADSSDARRSKVARLIDEYELAGVGDEFERRWTRTEDRSSLRELADEFNRRLLRTVLERTGGDPLDGEVDNLYRLLTGDDVTSGVRQQARNRVEDRGVDVEGLETDFVSYQAVRTYLKQYRDASPPDNTAAPDEQVRQKRSTIQRLSNRLGTVTEQSLGELASTSTITLGDFDVVVAVRVHCSSCETQLPVTELLAERGCNCD